MTKPKILILGHGRHGKDTVAEILNKDHGYSFISSSYFVGQKIMFDYFNELEDHPGYANFAQCYADRHNHRAEWHEQIAAYNTPDKARIAREILQHCDIYVGMRSDLEFNACMRKGLFDYVCWVDGSARGLPLEGTDSFNIARSPEMWIINNDGTLEELKKRVDDFVQHIALTTDPQFSLSLNH